MILGGSGLLGGYLREEFPQALCPGHEELDITDQEKVYRVVRDVDVVINAAAFTDVDGCESNLREALDVNGKGAGNVARACERWGAVMVHISTDYVFGAMEGEFDEDAVPGPVNMYGRSKVVGEREVYRNCGNFRIVRTSGLFGRGGKNFVDTVRRLSAKMGEVKVVEDQFTSPTYARDLTGKMREIIEAPTGIYHVTNSGSCSWYTLASRVIDNAIPCGSEEMPRPARRPRRSLLLNTRLAPMRSWEEAVDAYVEEGDPG